MSKQVKFTTKSMIIDGTRYKVRYQLNDDSLQVVATAPDGTVSLLTMKPGSEHYLAARAAYDEKLMKRTTEAADPETYAGLKLDGKWFRIDFDSSIDRATVTFKKKPSPEIRETVKAYGFWWTPSHKCWSRKLNNTAWWAGQELYKKLSA